MTTRKAWRRLPHPTVKVCPKRFAATEKEGRSVNKDARENRRRRLQALPSAGANTLSRKAGLLTCPPRRRLPGPGGPVAQECRNEKAPCGRDSQQRELLPIHTAFPFNSLHGETIARQRYTSLSAGSKRSGGIFPRNAPRRSAQRTVPTTMRPFPADGGATLARAL